MQQPIQTALHSTASLESQLSTLAAVDVGHASFLSCYLDARQGVTACRDFLTDRYLELAEGMPAAQRVLLDEAVTMVDAAFGHHWPSDVQTVVVFARPGAEERHLQVLPLVDVIPSRVEWYRLPQLLPLVESEAGATRFRLLLGRGRDLFVVDIAGHSVETRAWASPRLSAEPCPPIAGTDPRLIGLRRALLEQVSGPLVVAAAAPDIEELVRWLPSRSKVQFVERVAVPDYLDFNQAVRFVRDDFEDRRKLEAHLEVARLIRAARGRGSAVLGPVACLEALRRDEVETLVLARGASFPRVWHCRDCGGFHANGETSAACADCGGMSSSVFDFAAEIVGLAKRTGVDVVFSDVDELHYLGGVGCLLTQPVDAQLMRQAPPRRCLDLVA